MKRMIENTGKSKKIAAFMPSSRTIILLTVCLSCIISSLLVLLVDFAHDIRLFPSYALAIYPPMFEYIMMSLALTASGAFIMEYSVREAKK